MPTMSCPDGAANPAMRTVGQATRPSSSHPRTAGRPGHAPGTPCGRGGQGSAARRLVLECVAHRVGEDDNDLRLLAGAGGWTTPMA